MIQIFRKEVNAFFNSLIAYVIISIFLTGMGLILWVFPEYNILDYEYADMGSLFLLGPFVFLFLIPAITMRMFAEEKKSGTIEFLLTKPLYDYEIILGKYLAGFVIVLLSLLPTLIYYFSIVYLGNPPGNIDTAGTMGSYFGLIMLGAVFTSVGIFSSSFTENQVVAFIIGVFLCFIAYSGFSSLAAINVWGDFADKIESIGILYHYQALSKGLIDSRHIVYFLSFISIMLMLTNLVLGSRKW